MNKHFILIFIWLNLLVATYYIYDYVLNHEVQVWIQLILGLLLVSTATFAVTKTLKAFKK